MYSNLIARYLILALVTLALVAPSQEVSAQTAFGNSMGIEQAPQPDEVPIEEWIAEYAARIFVYMPQIMLNVVHETVEPQLPVGCYGWLEGYKYQDKDGIIHEDFLLCNTTQELYIYDGMVVTVRTVVTADHVYPQPLLVHISIPGIGLSEYHCWGNGRVLKQGIDTRELPSNYLNIEVVDGTCGNIP